MKNKIVIWGENQSNDKVLITLELKELDNNVEINVYPESVASEELYKSLMNDWKNDKMDELPQGGDKIIRPLSVSESLLPDELKVSQSDILTRAQTEWHFTVLSSKLYMMYMSELDSYKEKIDALSVYSDEMWQEMKNFWDKVQEQVRERNMFRDHASNLKERTNNLFDKLKVLRKEMKKQFEVKSGELAVQFNSKLDEIEKKISDGLALSPIFDDLKKIQNEFFDAKFTKRDKDSIWGRMDAAFKVVKEKKYGDKDGKGNKKGSRLQSRYDGLIKAIQRMENSINYDKKDVDFQKRKIDTTDGQLEMQIRQAKLKMIEERLKSKQSKHKDMLKTKAELEAALEKEQKRKEQKALDAEKEVVKDSIKQKIAAEIVAQKEELKEKELELKKAAGMIQDSKKPKASANKVGEDEMSLMEKIEQKVEDVVDTVAAIADVVEDKVEDIVDKITGEEE